MAIETTKDSVCINQIIGQKNESVLVEGDSIIPDIKPDILSAISTSGTVCIYKKEILDGKVRIDGSIDAYIIYLADDANMAVRSINSNIDFTQIIEIERVEPGMLLETKVGLKSIECRVLNGRKVSLKAILDIDVKVSSNQNVDIIHSVNIKDIQMLNKDLNINSLIGSGETKVFAKDTLIIDNIDNLSEVMKAEVKIVNKDTKISYNKALVKSDLNIKLLYLTEDNRINSVEGNIPIMGFIDIKDISEENMCDVKYEIKNLLVKANNVEEHSIYVDAEIQIYCQVYKKQSINLIQDLYSPSNNLIFTQRPIKVMQTKEVISNIYNIREKQNIPELQGNKIYDVTVTPEIQNQKLLNGRIIYEGEVKLELIFESRNGIDTKIMRLPFNFDVDFNGVNENSRVETTLDVGLQDFIVTDNDNIDMKIDLIFTTAMSKNAEINIIDDIQEGENKNINTYSMIIYFVKPNDTLWKIAKKFGSTVEEISRVNGIENVDKLNIAQQLFIPRYNG